MRLGWMEATLCESDVVVPGTERVLREDSGQLVLLDPPQGCFTVLEHTGRKLRSFAVEDPDVPQSDLGASAVIDDAESYLNWY